MSQQPASAIPAASAFAPKYVGLAQRLIRQIAKDNLRAGDRLGTELELCRKHGVSRVTVRQALAVLQREGYISRRKARGTFVTQGYQEAAPLTLVRGSVLVVCSNDQAAHIEEDFAFATVLRGIERTLAKGGFTVQILSVGEDEQADRARLAQMARRSDLEGVCTIGPCLEPYRAIFTHLPVVASCCFYSAHLPLVRQDVMQVTQQSVGYLLARGHRDIGLMCGPWIDQTAFSIFAEGCRRACDSAGVPFPRGLLYHAYPGESLQELAAALLTQPRRPTAVFAENWRVSEAVLSAAAQLGLSVPGDLSLIAYGQNVLRISHPVAVTTYVPNSEAIGAEAATVLTRLLDGETAPRQPLDVPGSLIERDSVRSLN